MEVEVNAKSITPILLLATLTLLFAAERAVVKHVKADGILKISWCCGIKMAGVTLPGSRVQDGWFEYFSTESVEALQELVEGKEITIDYITGGWFAERGRAYVYVDTIFVNAYLLREGYAYWDKKINHRLAEEFAAYEHSAKKLRKGLWISPFSMDESH